MTDPLVTVNILSYNRKDEILVTLQKVFEQDYKNIEVIVADNASTDGTVKAINELFPAVHVISMPSNAGCAGWSEGFKAAKGKYVLVLDDNAYPNKDAISRCIEIFSDNRHRNVACIAFNIVNLSTDQLWNSKWLPPNREEPCDVPIFVGCAYMLDAQKLLTSSLMPEHYFMFQIELPIAAQIHNQGYSIYYSPDIVGYHWFYDDAPYNIKKDILVFQNNLFFIVEQLPIVLSFGYGVQCLLFFFTRAVSRRWIHEYLRTVWKVFGGFHRVHSIRMRYFFQLRKLHIFNFTLASKLWKG